MTRLPGKRSFVKRKAPQAPAVLPACLTIREVTAVGKELGRALRAGATAIDASAVALIDTSGLQLLLAAARGGRVRYTSPSAALRAAAARTGLEVALRLEVAPARAPPPGRGA